jgi:hypothetical protein
MIFSALIVKFLSAGAVAQAATGATVAVVAFTGVGAVGALPDPVQDTFATVVAEITPLEPPTSEEPTEEVVPEGTLAEVEAIDEATEVPVDAEATETYVTAWALDGPEGYESFTAWVEEGNKDARVKDWLRAHGMTFGNVVSAHASGKGFSEEELAVLGGGVEEPVDPATEEESADVSETEDTVKTQAGTTVEDRGSRGNGNGNGKATGGNGGGAGGGGGNGRGNAKN